MKRRAGIAFLLAAIIFSSSLLFAETYLYSPLQNKWTGGVSGDVLSSQIANGSLYVLTAHITNLNGNSYYYTAYRFNLSTGTRVWSSSTHNITGSPEILMEPSHYGPLLHYYNNTVYLMAFNGSTIVSFNNNFNSFELMEMDATTGTILKSYELAPFQQGTYSVIGFTMNMIGKNLYLGYLNNTFSARQGHNNSFDVYEYELGNSAPLLLNNNSAIIPQVNGWGTASEGVYVSGQKIAYCMNTLGIALVFSSDGMVRLNMSGMAIGFNGQELYYFNSSSSYINISEVSVNGGPSVSMFNITQSPYKNVNYEYFAETNGEGLFYVITNAYPYGSFIGGNIPANLSFQRIQAFSSNGTVLWSHSLPTGSYASVLKHTDSSNGNIIVTALGQSSSEILLINNVTGKVQMEVNYHFHLNAQTGTTYPLTPPQFKEALIYSGTYLVYVLGNRIAIAEIN